MFRIRVDYGRSLRCRFGRHDKGDAERGCQGGFTPLGRGCARFCRCHCHDVPVTPLTFHYEARTIATEDGPMIVRVPVLGDSGHAAADCPQRVEITHMSDPSPQWMHGDCQPKEG